MQGISEQILANGLKNRDRTAMKDLYGLYSGYLAAVCSRYVTDRDSARDVLQESFIRIFSSIGSFQYRGEGSLKAWMTRIAVNESLKFLKSSSKDGFIIRTENLPENIPDVADGDLDIKEIPPSAIQEMVRRLPDGYRTIFNLYVFEDKSHREIAEILGIKENSSASQLHRAKALLAKWIKDYRNGNGTI